MRIQSKSWMLAVALFGLAVSPTTHATVLSSPGVSSSATPFNGSYVATNAVDGTEAEYASQGAGTGTFIEFDFGSAVTFDRVIMVNRNSPAGGDRVAQATLTYDVGSDTISTSSARGASNIYSLGSAVSTQNVRWDVDAVGTGGPAASNTGMMEMLYLITPANSKVQSASVIANAAAFSANFVGANAANGVVGRSSDSPQAIEYASASLGTGTFVDFDLGADHAGITGFDFVDRIGLPDRATSFDMIFSNDPTFATTIATKSYAPGSSSLTTSDVFGPIRARYVRYDVTGTGAANSNAGASEFIFYTAAIPEPGTLALAGFGLVGVALAARRRNRR